MDDKNKIHLWQKNLKSKFDEIEEVYNNTIDDLFEKLDDAGSLDYSTNFELTEFKFIQNWHCGKISSTEVCRIFEEMDSKNAAKNKLTQRLTNYMFKNEAHANLVKPAIAHIEENCLPRMIAYLATVKTFFLKLKKIDEGQMKVTWLEQHVKDTTITPKFIEVTINQAIRKIDGGLYVNIDEMFFYKDNVLVLDESANGNRTLHWLFAPKSYIDILKELYYIKEKLSDDEEEYLKSLLMYKV